MANFNKVLLMGNLTRDPEMKYLPSGTPVVEFGLAVNRQWKDQASGERREATTFVDCKSMGRQAEVINQYMVKGRGIFVEGRLDFRQWEAKDGSGKRSKIDVFVENFQFLGQGGNRDGGGGPPRQQQQQQQQQQGQGYGAQSPQDPGMGGRAPMGGGAPMGPTGDSYVPDDDVPF
ncbi:MAG: single-stranded DNA-binding protein [Planctomycetes bacterium]|nr:single-stranded DNA-binding protein [Planctomycetota bacterium]